MQKRRRPSNAMDGFVPRNRASSKRPSLDIRTSKHQKSDGFVPRRSAASQPIHMNDDSTWTESGNTLVIDGAEDQDISGDSRLGKTSRAAKIDKPHFWQFAKKRRIRKGKSEPSRRKKIIKRIFLIIFLIFVLIGGFLGWKVLKNATKVFNGSVLGLLDNTKLKGEENGRVNILLAGTSEDDPGHDGAKLTDSIMIVSIDTVNNKAFMLSIPRDLWVSYQTKNCSVGYQGKINATYACGEQTNFTEAGYPSGGMGLLEKVVEENFGLTINYYSKINYTAFKESVDAVNGIDITLKTNSPNGILDRIFDWECKYKCYKVKYPNGPLHLNGEQALDLARARGDATGYPTYGTGNDFGRTERQRQMLVALKDKALSLGILSNPAKLSSLLDAAGNNVSTDFKTNELHRLYDIGKKIPSQNIQSIGLTDETVNLVETFTAIGGQSAVRPVAGTTNFTQIKNYIKKLTSDDPIIREGAKVVVLNGSGTTGWAQKKADELATKGVSVVAVGNAVAREASVLVDLTNNQKSGTKAYLQKKFSATVSKDLAAYPEAKNYEADYVIILGKSGVSSTN